MEPRTIPFELKQTLPVPALIGVMKRGNEVLEKEKADAKSAAKKLEKALTDIALASYRLMQYEAEFSESAKTALKMLTGALSINGITLKDYLGETVDDELASNVRIVGWKDGDQPFETVYECYTPEVKLGDNLLHSAEVFCKRRVNEIEGENA
ncbi:MAG: hypothetical protein LBL98_06430 [Ruminococcus sp.]|jgi:hypothetical protein|nr:hypothetical protein [Ruminococcus sp.]